MSPGDFPVSISPALELQSHATRPGLEEKEVSSEGQSQVLMLAQ